MTSQGLKSNAKIGDLLDELEAEGYEGLAEEIEEKVEIEGLSNSDVIDTLIERLKADA